MINGRRNNSFFDLDQGYFCFIFDFLIEFDSFFMDIEENKPYFLSFNPDVIQMQNRIGRGCQGCVYNAYNK
jgi:hypothetical protein